MLLLKSMRCRKVILSLFAILFIHFAHVPRVEAGGCSWKDILLLGIPCIMEKLGESAGRTIAEGLKPEYQEMVDHTAQKLVDHINKVDWQKIGQELGKGASEEVLKALNTIKWEEYGQQIGVGIRQEFEAAMDKLFDDKIKPILKDIDLILETRIDQVDTLINEKLKRIDGLIQETVVRFQTAADNTIAKVKSDLIDYAFNRFQSERNKTIAQIRAEVIDYATDTVNKTTDEIVAKVKGEVIDHTFAQLDQLRHDFRQEVNQFFERAENLLTLLDCTEEKTRIDMENFIKRLGKELAARCPPMLCGPSSKADDDPTLVACYEQLHLKKPPKSWQYTMIYRLEKCEVLSGLTADTPIENIAAIYLDLHNWAKRIACIQRSPKAMWDSLEFKSRYHYWSAFP
jgi:hypothetical protein